MQSHLVGELVLVMHPYSQKLQPAELLDTQSLPLGRVLARSCARADRLVHFCSSGELFPMLEVPYDIQPIRCAIPNANSHVYFSLSEQLASA
jgi:hypothetical protein